MNGQNLYQRIKVNVLPKPFVATLLSHSLTVLFYITAPLDSVSETHSNQYGKAPVESQVHSKLKVLTAVN